MPLTTVEARTNDPHRGAYVDALDAYGDDLDVAFASRTATVDDRRVHYLEAGDGPPLLCLHGISTSAATWLPLVESLADEFRVIAPDRPGRGRSDSVDYGNVDFREFGVDYVTGLLDALDLDSVRVLGSSLGGMQALHLQVDHPERVERNCLVGAPAGLSRDVPWLLRLTYAPKLGAWLFRRNVADTVEEAREGWQQINLEDDSALSDALLKVELAGERIPGQTDSLVSLNYHGGTVRGGMHEKFVVRDELAASEVPTRFVWGSEDFFWPPSVGEPVAEAMPAGSLVVLHDHGHTPWLEPTTAARDAILEFLAD